MPYFIYRRFLLVIKLIHYNIRNYYCGNFVCHNKRPCSKNECWAISFDNALSTWSNIGTHIFIFQYHVFYKIKKNLVFIAIYRFSFLGCVFNICFGSVFKMGIERAKSGAAMKNMTIIFKRSAFNQKIAQTDILYVLYIPCDGIQEWTCSTTRSNRMFALSHKSCKTLRILLFCKEVVRRTEVSEQL